MKARTVERPLRCKLCKYKTYNRDRICAFCRPDPAEAWAAVDEAEAER